MKLCILKRRRKRNQGKKKWIVRSIFALFMLLVGGFFFSLLLRSGRINIYANQGMQIAPVYQFDYTETVCYINGERKSVSSSGCGAACLSMIITYLTGNEKQTPHTLFVDAYENGDYAGYGLTHEAIDRLAKPYGIQSAWVEPNETVIIHALENGYPVIAHMGSGTFTSEGHYILLRGVTSDGKILVNDPNSRSRTARAYSFYLIENEAKGETPFMICWTEK